MVEYKKEIEGGWKLERWASPALKEVHTTR